ncbi:hypothetical protein [Amycolatopsis sp. PS_44_ISF1]|uniref:hypothetical protein n=1 Tax=Amycolatopsis sp. PS_44_ISF1 TaxID=2974917 RepID=UPI0028DF1D02|nr:hypothetical protein [Amycolatopsis sp. PS_44_ISF1]MDT8912089.1 hypothetical protein [Amycolatopsis sp. PS_44_ISF1]
MEPIFEIRPLAEYESPAHVYSDLGLLMPDLECSEHGGGEAVQAGTADFVDAQSVTRR